MSKSIRLLKISKRLELLKIIRENDEILRSNAFHLLKSKFHKLSDKEFTVYINLLKKQQLIKIVGDKLYIINPFIEKLKEIPPGEYKDKIFDEMLSLLTPNQQNKINKFYQEVHEQVILKYKKIKDIFAEVN